ncbi:MAG: hypothetical protein U0694_27320 [Anaerolineae bacterium]
MIRLLKSLFTITYPYTNPIDTQRAKALLVLIWLFVGSAPLVAFIPSLLAQQDLGLLNSVY